MTTIKATKGEFVNLVNGLFQVQDLKGKKFSLVISKNITLLKKKLKNLEKASKPSEEFLILANKVNEISKQSPDTAQEKIDQLEKENKEIVETRRSQMESVNKMLEENATVKLKTISENDLPNEITAKQINSIEKIINN